LVVWKVAMLAALLVGLLDYSLVDMMVAEKENLLV
jgi:hypothetical protein